MDQSTLQYFVSFFFFTFRIEKRVMNNKQYRVYQQTTNKKKLIYYKTSTENISYEIVESLTYYIMLPLKYLSFVINLIITLTKGILECGRKM